jgi:hypothetical protein
MRCVPDTSMEVVDRFGALTFDPHPTIGVWTQTGRRYDDQLYRLALDVPDTDDSRHWIATFKKEVAEPVNSTNDAGVAALRRATCAAAGWMRRCSAVKSHRPPP